VVDVAQADQRFASSSRRHHAGTELKWNQRLSGQKIGRYRLGARLGVGGAASVYLGRLTGPHGFERMVALKLIHEHLLDEAEFVSMFLDEAKLVSRLAHPNIVQVFELGRHADLLFAAMEYLVGARAEPSLRRSGLDWGASRRRPASCTRAGR
jgi:serine/threonine protein kinase